MKTLADILGKRKYACMIDEKADWPEPVFPQIGRRAGSTVEASSAVLKYMAYRDAWLRHMDENNAK